MSSSFDYYTRRDARIDAAIAASAAAETGWNDAVSKWEAATAHPGEAATAHPGEDI